jgi:hypothetical protein
VKYYDEETSYERITPAAVLTGQPGVGDFLITII